MSPIKNYNQSCVLICIYILLGSTWLKCKACDRTASYGYTTFENDGKGVFTVFF